MNRQIVNHDVSISTFGKRQTQQAQILNLTGFMVSDLLSSLF
jgi:hypothetical protein